MLRTSSISLGLSLIALVALVDPNAVLAAPRTTSHTDLVRPALQTGVRSVRRSRSRTASAPRQLATPLLLQDVERANEALMSPKTKHRPVYRGFAFENYGGREVVRYLFGDWKHMIASHTFSKTVAAEQKKGRSFYDALTRTARKISQTVTQEVQRDGLLEYMQAQSRGTWLGIKPADKQATAMASYPGNPFRGQIMTPSPFSYAATGYNGIVGHKVVKQTDAMIVVEVDQRVPSVKIAEPQIISHVPPTKISRVFLGYSNWHDVSRHDTPPEQVEHWFALEVLGRDKVGRPLDIRVKPMNRTRHGDIFESWKLDRKEQWQASKADTSAAKAFAAKYPRLATTLREASAQVEAARRGGAVPRAR